MHEAEFYLARTLRTVGRWSAAVLSAGFHIKRRLTTWPSEHQTLVAMARAWWILVRRHQCFHNNLHFDTQWYS